ncbi:Large exoprotein involved in heme utilization or adhesion [Candidatus Burkholderia humilis]|nr:Large exoprotein involved in heme utilization or adhesion [Candidatus Burkholderia humilis]
MSTKTALCIAASGGVYKGALKGSDTYTTLLILFGGTAYLFYGAPGGANLSGVVVASNGAQRSDGRYSSASALDYRIGSAPAPPVALMANFANAPAVSGAAVNKDGSPNLAFSASAASMLDVAPSLVNASGLYNGCGMSFGGATDTRLTVAANGYAAGTTSSGCIFKGRVAPHAGVNAYDVAVTFGPAPCPNATVNGNAILDGPRLLVALPSPDRANVFFFDGRK